MSETAEYEEKIMYLATVFRTEFSEKEELNWGSSQKNVEKLERIYHKSNRVDSTENPNFLENEEPEEGTVLPKKLYMGITEWNKAFSKLRPPLNLTKKRSHGGTKVANKSCEEILQVVRSYKEGLETEKESQKNGSNAREVNKGVSHLWHNGSAVVQDSVDEEFLEQFHSTRECSETPIPRNISRF